LALNNNSSLALSFGLYCMQSSALQFLELKWNWKKKEKKY